MTKVATGASVSLDGYISGPEMSGFEHLFAWYSSGSVEYDMGGIVNQLTEASAAHLRALVDSTGALVCGRGLYDAMNAWGGKHPMGVPVVVLTHRPAPDTEWFKFVTGGIAQAISVARGLAGGKDVGLNGGVIASQALDAGLVDEIGVDLVPVILGAGTPFFSSLGSAPFVLEGPVSVVESERVTHLRYRVVRS